MDKIIRKLYEDNREENNGYFIDLNKQKVYIPKDSELLYNFIRRVWTKIKYEAMNDGIDYIIAKAMSNPFRNYALLSFTVDSRDELGEAIDKYKVERKKLVSKLAKGE